jgi:hypothetical protein
MTNTEKLSQIKILLDISDASEDAKLTVYLDLARAEILSWLYSGKTPEAVTEVPAQYETTQVFAVVAGYSLSGAENQTAHTENSITRQFKYSDMVQYIRNNVMPYLGGI